MEQNILIAVGVFSIICVICVAAIGLSVVKQNEKLKEKISNEKKPMYNVWLSALSNNLPMLIDGKDLYSINTEIKSFKLSDLKPTEKDVALAVQKQQFDTKEKMYVEKIRQLEKEVLYQKGRVDYFENRLYKEINKESEKQFKVVMTVTKEDDNILDAVDNVLAEANKQDVNINTNRGLK